MSKLVYFRKAARLGLVTAVLAAAVTMLLPLASAATTTARNGVCESNEFCLYYNSSYQGSVSDFNTSIADYGDSLPSCYTFKGAGAGQGQCVKNNAASAWNRRSTSVTVYVNSGYQGAVQTITSGSKANLNETLKNENASHKFGSAAAVDNLVPTATFDRACFNVSEQSFGIPCQTDNAALAWWMEDSIDWTTSGSDTPLEYGINLTQKNSYNGTDLNTAYDASPVFSGSGETDIIYRSRPSDFANGNLIGQMWCDDAVDGEIYTCDQAYVNIRSTGYGRALACHETGHAVGLTHGSEASPVISRTDPRLECMVTPYDSSRLYLGDNNARNINSVY